MIKPRLPWQVATRPLTAEDGWRAQRTQEAAVYICIFLGKGKQCNGYIVMLSFCVVLIDLA